ncbi:MAG: NMD3-related protein [Candidatus Aenigmatarchaeota archaeon]
MANTFCFKCGKKTAELTGGKCAACLEKEAEIAAFPAKIEITRCSKCGMAKTAGKWAAWEPKLLLKKAKVKGKVMEFRAREEGGKFVIQLGGYPRGSDKAKTELHEVRVNFNRITCPVCSRRLGNYYEAVVQLRWKSLESRLRAQQVKEFIADQLRKKENDPMAFFRVEERKEGTDFLIGSKKAAKAVAKAAKEEFGAEVKESFILVTKKENEDVYRNVYSVRI